MQVERRLRERDRLHELRPAQHGRLRGDRFLAQSGAEHHDDGVGGGLSEESVAAKAPVLCWPQLVKPVTLVQSAFDLHGTAGLLNELLTLLRQKPQKTFGWSGRSVALTDVAPVPSTKLMASGEPITRPAGGGQSWLVGYASLSGESPGVQVRPSFGPPLQTRVVALQIGHVWMSVLQVPPAQSSFVMQPKPASLPPTHRPRSQEPPTPQSAFARHAVSAGLVPRRHRPVSFWHVPPPGQSAAVLQDAPGFEPPLQRSGSRSPVRKRRTERQLEVRHGSGRAVGRALGILRDADDE